MASGDPGNVMRCPQCRHENPGDAKFCLECGRRLAVICQSCETALPAGAKFCKKCGQPVGTSTPVHFRTPAPDSYTPRHLAERIINSKAALEGERKQVTVLFADLKGSMELLADRDPEEARKLLDPVLERMMEAVHRYEGTVNQVMGDGIMALFGAPLAHEDHAVRACYAALRMQESVKQYAEGVRREQGVTIRIRVGLNSGEVVVRAIGSDLHMDYTAVGQTTHLAARMEQLADPGASLLTPETLALAEGFVQVTSLGPMAVKGLPARVGVYELVGAGAVRSRLHAAAARGLTRFVGRDSEVDQLSQALEQAQAGHGQVVAVIGEPGVGKSRLYWEFTHSHRVHGSLILESGSVSYGKTTAYLLVIDLLKAYFDIEGRDDTRTIREKVTGKVLSLDRTLEPSLPALLSLLEIPVEDEAWGRLDPVQRRQRTLDAVKHLLLRASQVQPLLVLFEDLHWIDAETQSLVDSLVESLPTAQLLLLVNYRPEYQHLWGSKTYYRQLRIDPLPEGNADDLLTSLLGTEPSLDALKRTLIERTEGNPLFLEESVRTLVETKTLIGEQGAYRLAHDATAIRVPATVQAILAARIDRLSPKDKGLLQAAAVIGKDVPFALLAAIGDEPEEDLRRGLSHLQAAEFLYEVSLFPDLEYTFKHPLTHEVAYGSILQERRRSLHRRIVEAIEGLYAKRLTEQVDRLAHHALRGDMWDKAVQYSQESAAKAYGRSALRETTASFEQALIALQHLPESRVTREQTIDFRIDLHAGLLGLGERERAADVLREAETLAEALGDHRRLGRLLQMKISSFYLTADYDRAISTGQRAIAVAQASADVGCQAQVNSLMAHAYYHRGEYRRAIDCCTWTVTALKGEMLHERFGLPIVPAVSSRGYLAWCLAEMGAFAEGIALGGEAVRIAEETHHPFSLTFASTSVGLAHLRKGDIATALPALARALSTCQDANLVYLFPLVAAPLGVAYAQSGRIADALPLLQQAVERAASIGRMDGQALRIAWLSEAHLLAGHQVDADDLAQRAHDLADANKERGIQTYTLRLIGEIATHRAPPPVEPAVAAYQHARVLAEELGMRPLVAHCHLGLGKLYRRTGKRERAQEHLTTAITMYREMDMRFYLEQAEAELQRP